MENKKADIFDFVEPCEPNCTKGRHAYHQGQWDMAKRANKFFGLGPYPGGGELVAVPLQDEGQKELLLALMEQFNDYILNLDDKAKADLLTRAYERSQETSTNGRRPG